MNPKLVDEAGFTVIGIETRTNNAHEMSGAGVIASQWGHFMRENLLGQIPGKTDDTILAVYSDYASDQNGDYSFMIGARASAGAALPAGMVARKVVAGRYAVFPSEVGLVEKVVAGTWQKVWTATGIERVQDGFRGV